MALVLTPMEWLAASAVILAGTVIQGSLGFGVTMLSAPLLYLIDPRFVPAPMIVVGSTVATLVLWRERRSVDLREVSRVLPGEALGVAAAAAVVGVVSDATLGLLFGSLVLLAVALSLVHRPPEPGPRLLFVAGTLSGFMATATSIGGPPLALVFQGRAGGQLRGTLSACFVPLGVLALAALYAAGRMGAAELIGGLALLPGVALGFGLSVHTARALDRRWLRGAVLAVSALAALAAIADALV